MSTLASLTKRAISVTTNIEPETGFVAGFPTSPRTAIARTEVLAIPRRTPKTVSLMTSGSVPTAISEGARQEVDNLERKFGSDPFLQGFLDELDGVLEKDATFKAWLYGMIPGLKPKILSMKERPISISRPIKPPEPGAVFARMDPMVSKLEARRARGRRQPL